MRLVDMAQTLHEWGFSLANCDCSWFLRQITPNINPVSIRGNAIISLFLRVFWPLPFCWSWRFCVASLLLLLWVPSSVILRETDELLIRSPCVSSCDNSSQTQEWWWWQTYDIYGYQRDLPNFFFFFFFFLTTIFGQTELLIFLLCT